MKRAGVWLAAVAGVLILGGCATGKDQVRKQREKDNIGDMLRGDISVAVTAAEKTLQEKGYRVTKKSNQAGPNLSGMVVSGDKDRAADLEESTKDIARDLGMAVLNGEKPAIKHIQTESGEIVQVFLNRRWDDSFEAAVPEVTVVSVQGNSYKKDSKGKYYDKVDMNALELDAIRDKIQQKVIDVYKYYKRKI